MSLDIKSEKCINSEISEVSLSVYKKLCADHEKLKLTLALKNQRCENQVQTLNKLNVKIEEQSRTIVAVQSQCDSLKQREISLIDTIRWKDMQNKELYNALSSLRNENTTSEVSNPKEAIIKINKVALQMKKLKERTIENRVLLQTLCRILNCEDVTIIKSIKDIIQENESNKKKTEKLQNFFERSIDFTNNLCNDLYSSGTIPNAVTVGVTKTPHEDGITAFEKRMAKLKTSLKRKATNVVKFPSFTSLLNLSQITEEEIKGSTQNLIKCSNIQKINHTFTEPSESYEINGEIDSTNSDYRNIFKVWR